MDADDAEPVCLAVFEEEADNDNDENKTTATYSIIFVLLQICGQLWIESLWDFGLIFLGSA